MSLFGGLNAFADVVKQNGVVYDKISDDQCFVVNYDEATMPEDGKVTIAATVNIDGVDYTVSGILEQSGLVFDAVYDAYTDDQVKCDSEKVTVIAHKA